MGICFSTPVYSTLVSNGCDETIYAMVTSDKRYEVASTHRGSGKGGATAPSRGVVVQGSGEEQRNFEWEKTDHSGYTRIAPRQSLRFEHEKKEVYVSIYILKNDGSQDVLAKCFPIYSERDVIVTRDKVLRRAKKGYLWNRSTKSAKVTKFERWQ
eukprot:TRINITY_DN67016_c0_g1_i1.p1 TRINITY_DN67016_c0_g1~~TRINITY_DN67016_c0_g1_i1.p1  ORF type:complete len:155 (+),score=1.89 TRINITY_DN67016_c0_g1_i1:126-590(+)